MTDYLAFELNQSTEAPCDSACVTFLYQPLEEMKELEIWLKTQRVFWGPVDSQTVTWDSKGARLTFWARSGAAFLVDSVCVPCSYHKPTAQTLFLRYGAPHGLKEALPVVLLDGSMDVTAGTSGWNALETLVKTQTGKQIFVDSDWTVRVFQPSETVTVLTQGGRNGFTALRHRIRRSAPVGKVYLKQEKADAYTRSASLDSLQDRQIGKTRCLNLSGIAPWQRSQAVRQLLLENCRSYRSIQATLPTLRPMRLYDRVRLQSEHLGNCGGLLVAELQYTSDSSGDQTILTLLPEQEGQVVYRVE